MALITYPNKNTGDEYTSGMANEVKSVVNTNRSEFDTQVSNLNNADSARLLKSDVVWGEVPTGTKNGVNVTFTIAYANPTQKAVYADGIRTNPSGYSISGTTLTMVTPPDNSLLIDYIK